jgi:hypothetical protein
MDAGARALAETRGATLRRTLLTTMGVAASAAPSVPLVQQLHLVWRSPSTGRIVVTDKACRPQCTLRTTNDTVTVHCMQRRLRSLLRQVLGSRWTLHFGQAVLRSAPAHT